MGRKLARSYSKVAAVSALDQILKAQVFPQTALRLPPLPLLEQLGVVDAITAQHVHTIQSVLRFKVRARILQFRPPVGVSADTRRHLPASWHVAGHRCAIFCADVIHCVAVGTVHTR